LLLFKFPVGDPDAQVDARIGFSYIKNVKVTVEFSDNELKDILRLSGEKKKGPAIRKFVTQELMLKRRREISRKVLAGEIRAELPAFERLRKNRNVWGR
jgi:hypothetical protein